MTFAETIRVRLLARVNMAGLSLHALSRQMGRSNSYLGRKLAPPADGERRELTTAEVDEILAALSLPPTAALEPVLAPGDRELLAYCARNGAPTRPEVAAIFRDSGAALERLAAQGFIGEEAFELITITDDGRRIAA